MKHIPIEYKKYTYNDLVSDVIKAGIEPKRAYIFLAGLGIRGEMARWEEAPRKLGTKDKCPVNEAGETILSAAAVFKHIDMPSLGVGIKSDK